ncbi:diguanylate cyclase (GGDEF)-like protein [Sporosarcina luteola]|nr:diguanylate cyclase (GGDEF)-like protein [Sporosarcina luteola]
MQLKDYQKLLRKRIEQTFADWKEVEFITEKELYHFLHSLHGTAGTIGMDDLSLFCAKQLSHLTSDSQANLPAGSLKNFKKRVRELVEKTIPTTVNHVDTTDKLDGTFFLIIDNDLDFISRMKDILEPMGAQVIAALDGKRGVEQFFAMRPVFTIIEIELPDMSGFSVLEQICETAQSKHLPIIMLHKTSDRDVIKRTYELGASDFIQKPIDLDLFLPFLFNRNEMRKSIERSTISDGLTGTGNRRHFDEVLNQTAQVSKQTNTPFSLVMIDLDRFKEVNDTYGHLVGDEVLRMVGKLFLDMKGKTDHIFRYGGEEFAWIFPETHPNQAVHMVEHVRNRLRGITFNGEARMFSVTFSAGVAAYDKSLSVEGLIASADRALYEAKRTGRNKTVIYDPTRIVAKRKIQVMIVDDDLLLRTILYDTLNKWKPDDIEVTVHSYEDGQTFLSSDWYDADSYFIILLDGVMPGMDGLEVLGRLKKDHAEKNVLVSMMTARTSESDIKAALSYGADDYIMKPFQAEDLLARVRNLADRMLGLV